MRRDLALAGNEVEEMILVADNDPSVRDLVGNALLRQGYHVLQAANGVEALTVVRLHVEEPIDLLVTEVVMPQMGGIELIVRLRAMQPEFKVLFISAEYIIPQVLRVYRGEFLKKPFTGDALVAKVTEILAK